MTTNFANLLLASAMHLATAKEAGIASNAMQWERSLKSQRCFQIMDKKGLFRLFAVFFLRVSITDKKDEKI